MQVNSGIPKSTTTNNAGNNNQQQQQQQTNPQSQGFSFSKRGDLFKQILNSKPGSEILTNLLTRLNTFNKELTSRTPGIEIGMYSIDCNQETNFDLSSITITLKYSGVNKIAFFTFIIQDSNTQREIPKSINKTIFNENIEIRVFQTDAFEKDLLVYIKNNISSTNTNNEVYYSGGAMIPSLLAPRLKNKEDGDILQVLMSKALTACQTKLMSLDLNTPDLNLKQFKGDSTIVFLPSFGVSDIDDGMGMVCRSSVKVDMLSRQIRANDNNYQPNKGSQDVCIATMNGFIDVVYMPHAQANQYNNFNNNPFNNNLAYQKFAARLIITHLENNYISSLPGICHALLNATILQVDNNWYANFDKKVGFNEKDFHDIGGLNIEANINNSPNGGERIDTSRDKFGPSELGTYLNMIMRPGLIISMDVPDCGSTSWYLYQFAQAAMGDLVAKSKIYDACQLLTNGGFANYFKPTDLMFEPNVERIHLGYYRDNNNVIKDIRNIDYLYVLNSIGERDIDVVKKWSDSFITTNMISPEKQLMVRTKIIETLVPSAELIGMATRITPTTVFLEAIAKGAQSAGFSARLDMKNLGSDIHNQRANAASMFSNSMNSNNRHGFINQGWGGVNNNTNNGGNRSFRDFNSI